MITKNKLTPEERKNLREEAKHQKMIQEVKSQPPLESLTITIEWKKSRMWGRNPHATGEAITKDGRRLVGTSTASGCGYCKTSTVIADLFNQFLRHKLYDKKALYRIGKHKPYGISFPKDGQRWLPVYEGGIGEGSYRKISEAIGGEWHPVAYTDNVQVYRYSEVN